MVEFYELVSSWGALEIQKKLHCTREISSGNVFYLFIFYEHKFRPINYTYFDIIF